MQDAAHGFSKEAQQPYLGLQLASIGNVWERADLGYFMTSTCS